ARYILSEMSTSAPVPQFDTSNVLKIVALITLFGFLFVTIGAAILYKIDRHGPIPIMFALSGFGALVLICRYLLRLISPAAMSGVKQSSMPPSYAPRTTNRALTEPSSSYNSVIEEPTQQIEGERRAR
ncbi:MAG: hypothetical protein L0220_34615, partial [Acidobacteria bacterium]|nr:hypothetical protein [Acidobacteriota bacterium]